MSKHFVMVAMHVELDVLGLMGAGFGQPGQFVDFPYGRAHIDSYPAPSGEPTPVVIHATLNGDINDVAPLFGIWTTNLSRSLKILYGTVVWHAVDANANLYRYWEPRSNDWQDAIPMAMLLGGVAINMSPQPAETVELGKDVAQTLNGVEMHGIVMELAERDGKKLVRVVWDGDEPGEWMQARELYRNV